MKHVPGRSCPACKGWCVAGAGVRGAYFTSGRGRLMCIRVDASVSQAAAAAALGVTERTVRNWEHADRAPTPAVVSALAEISANPERVRETAKRLGVVL